MKKIEAKIIADSISPQGHRITSVLLTYPRFIHAELMTHRMFSRNSASSRAIPFAKMVKMVEEDPFIPIAWQKDHKGMQGTEYFTEFNHTYERRETWIDASRQAIKKAEWLNKQGVTKQLCNRLLEPFMWHTVLVTATEWENFFELRCPQYWVGNPMMLPKRSWKDLVKEMHEQGFDSEPSITTYSVLDKLKFNQGQAEIHMIALAEAMWDAMNESTPKELEAGEWHIPFGDKFDYNKIDELNEGIGEENEIKIATARCARLSYMTFDGEIDYEKDVNLHNHLLESHHMSPFEHCARAMSDEEYFSHFKGNKEWIFTDESKFSKAHGWCNNFKGWISYRHLVEEERRKS